MIPAFAMVVVAMEVSWWAGAAFALACIGLGYFAGYHADRGQS